jgi:predicted solute-binding protein
VTFPISIAESILTRYLRAGVGNMPDAQFAEGTHGFAVIEAARLASLPEHVIHPDVGVSVRDRGVVVLQSAVRPDELQQPTIRVRTSGPTAELLARATVGQYFGFRPRAWVDSADANAEAVVCDEAAALMPLESGHREDLTRAWFVLTGLRFVSHVLAVPRDADSARVAAVAEWFRSGGSLDQEERHVVDQAIASETGAELTEVAAVMAGIRWDLDVDERRSVTEFFARAGVAGQVGAVRWRRNEYEPEE